MFRLSYHQTFNSSHTLARTTVTEGSHRFICSSNPRCLRLSGGHELLSILVHATDTGESLAVSLNSSRILPLFSQKFALTETFISLLYSGSHEEQEEQYRRMREEESRRTLVSNGSMEERA